MFQVLIKLCFIMQNIFSDSVMQKKKRKNAKRFQMSEKKSNKQIKKQRKYIFLLYLIF